MLIVNQPSQQKMSIYWKRSWTRTHPVVEWLFQRRCDIPSSYIVTPI